MLEWLNRSIGTDWATYIGAFLGIIALFWGSNKLTTQNTNKQLQKSGKNSTNIQVGGDITINPANHDKSNER